MKPTEKLDIKLQAEVLGLGQALSDAKGAGRRVSPRQPPANPDALSSAVENVLKMVRASPARQLFGIKQNYVDVEDAVRLKAIALVAWEMIGEANTLYVNDLARTVVDGRGILYEQLLLARDCLARMVCDGLLVIQPNCGDYWDGKMCLPQKTASWMAGGPKSKGDFDPRKLDTARLHKNGNRDGENGSATQKRLPTARQLYETVRTDVIGLDPQIKQLASRISLHVARAEMLKAGMDDNAVAGTVILLAGASGSGKSFVISRLARHSGLGFIHQDSTVLTSQGYVGSDLDEPYRLLVNSLGGDVQEASRGIILFDEFDKKSLRYGRDIGTLAIQQELLGRLQASAPFVIGGKRQFDCRPYLFDGRPTGYFLAGVFQGLEEIIDRKANRRGMGFSSESGSREHIRIQDALKEYGYIDELVNRISCVVTLPDPTIENVMLATANGLLDGFNRVLDTRGAVLFPTDAAIRAIGGYAIESKGFYRSAKAVLASLVSDLFFDLHRGTIVIEPGDVHRAIDRLSSGIVRPDAEGNSQRSVNQRGMVSRDTDPDMVADREDVIGSNMP